ncbi:hypothetical protein Sango_2625400 [Sesamum angolense]|uniref:Leucine-rich repeat-containing N-terminal plant-type domain-containing protein n=1 Tax=Sesamum angolense TaxID=2727404 RepID=A0AAE1W1H8_9LAMI|nr:hypothetical protein Sango_2625400 [Sesamum angolense]
MSFGLVHCFFIVFILSFFCSNAVESPDRESLLSFKNSLENPQVLLSWSPSVSHCNWTGVFCNEGRVTSLVLSTHTLAANQLKGPLSTTLFSLTSLVVLDLSSNQLYGEVSPEIASLSRLEVLDLGYNRLTGELPSRLGDLTRLQTLRLGPNFFTGKIPPELGNLVQLESFDLSGNSLTGNNHQMGN